MKKTFYLFLMIMGAVGLSFLTSCEPKPCELVNCAYGGVCDEGACICQVGYEGIHCETVARDKFIDNGIYQVNEDGSLSAQAQYSTTVLPGDNPNEIKILNVRNTLLDDYVVIATVSHDTMWIAPQNTPNGYQIEGRGVITGKQNIGRHYYFDAIIDLTYKVTNLSDNSVDEFGTNGTQPSNWNKN